MLGYISSTRKKSCHPCVKAKRRCDLRYPICERCFEKDLECLYPNAASRTDQAREEYEVVVRQTTPDLIPFENAAINDAYPTTTAHGTVDTNFTSAVIFEDTSSNDESPERIGRSDTYTSLVESLLPQIWEPRIVSQYQLAVIVNELCTCVPTIAYEGSTLFLHKNLYQDWQPPAYQDNVSLSALYMAKTYKNVKVLASSINHKILTLISTSSGWTLIEHLAAVQAIISYQIIRLFDPTLGQQHIGHRQNALLELWAATLWKRSFIESPPFPKSSYQSWIFQESLRRTVLISIYVRSAWSRVTNNGLCDLVPTLARLPVACDVKLWNMDSKEWMERGVIGTGKPDRGLVTYGDLSYIWNPVNGVENLDPFERLLVVACRWDDDPTWVNKVLADTAFASSMQTTVDT